jgi:hypothetical protein
MLVGRWGNGEFRGAFEALEADTAPGDYFGERD